MLTLDRSQPITLDDGSYEFAEQSGSILRLRNTATGVYRDMHIAELSQHTIGLPRHLAPLPPRTFDQIPQSKRKAVMELAEHIQELDTGLRPGHDTPRPEYNPATTTLNQRVTTKIGELREEGKPASRATLLRHLKQFREFGASALIDRRAIRTQGPLDRINADVLAVLCEVIGKQEQVSTGTTSRIIQMTKTELRNRFHADAPALPSTPTMYRYIQALTIGKHTTGSARTRRSLANRPDRTFKTRTEILPGGEMQVDSTVLDVLVRDAKGKAKRPILTVLLDRATRMVVAFTLRLTATKGIDHVVLLAQCLTPPQNRPDKSVFRADVQRANPHVRLLTDEERNEYEARRPFIHPRRIVMDNGKDYVSEAFLAALQLHHVDVSFSAPHTPTSKPLVERNFGSINSLLLQYLPGYTGRSPEHRGYKVEDENLMDLWAMHEVLDDWFLKVWNHRPHGGLRDRMHPEVKLTPAQMYAAASRVTANLQIPLTRDDYIEMMPSKFVAIRSTGVQYKYRQYDSPLLHPLRQTKSRNAGKNGKWEMKHDPYNPWYVWVRSPEDTWIECTIRNNDGGLYPHIEDHVIDARPVRDQVAAVASALTGTPMHYALPPAPENAEAEWDWDTADTTQITGLSEFDPTER